MPRVFRYVIGGGDEPCKLGELRFADNIQNRKKSFPLLSSVNSSSRISSVYPLPSSEIKIKKYIYTATPASIRLLGCDEREIVR
jgi:hypothetical protein